MNNNTAIEHYLNYRQTRISHNFHRDTGLVLRAWIATAGPLEHLRAEDLQHWFDHKCSIVKVSTAASYATWIRVFLAWCVKEGIRADNPALSLEIPRFPKPYRKVFVSRATVKRLIDQCQDMELKYCLFCGFHAGLRFEEVVMSRPEWFDLAEGLLHVTRSLKWETKDGEDRTIPLTNDFLAFLRVYGLRVPYMIAPHKQTGKRYRYTFHTRFENYITQAGVRISFHDCRRTFASLHVSAGTSLYKVSKWLGDGYQVVEKHYGHLLPRDDEINRAFA